MFRDMTPVKEGPFCGTAHGKTVCFARLATLHAVTGSIYES